eukprot:6186403-Pleurochrysis_carterae.AAC.1
MHHVCSTAFGATGTRTWRSSVAGQPPSLQDLQDRLGFHTFRRGDIVTYTAKREGDTDYEG